MGFLDTKNKRKSAVLTSLIMSLLLVAIFFFGLKYLDPPEEYGIAVNFGTSDVGQGNVQPKAPLKPAGNPVEANQEEVQEEAQEEIKEEVTTKAEQTEVEESATTTEEVLTQETEDAIAIKKAEEARKKQEAEDRKKEEERLERERIEAERKEKERLEAERIERERQEAIAKKKAEEDAKKAKLDAMIGGVKNASGTEEGGEGNDNQAGDKGKITGDPNASGYYGNGGSGGDGDYNLGNRKPLSRPKPDYICDEEGLVVVRIEVDQNGYVIKATPGVKGTTNSAECLKSQAKEAALKTRWNSDSNAPSKQVGTIKYRFSLSQ